MKAELVELLSRTPDVAGTDIAAFTAKWVCLGGWGRIQGRAQRHTACQHHCAQQNDWVHHSYGPTHLPTSHAPVPPTGSFSVPTPPSAASPTPR